MDPSLAGQMDQGPLAKAWDQGRSLELPQGRRSCAEVVKPPFSGTEELYKKDLHDPDNHNGVITDLEPDILE